MENRFTKKKSKRNRKKSLSSLSSSVSSSFSNPLRGSDTTTSDNYEDPWKKAQKENIQQSPQGADLEDGYESDHVLTLPQRCAMTLSFRGNKSKQRLIPSLNGNNNNSNNNSASSSPSHSERPSSNKSTPTKASTPNSSFSDRGEDDIPSMMPPSLSPSHLFQTLGGFGGGSSSGRGGRSSSGISNNSSSFTDSNYGMKNIEPKSLPSNSIGVRYSLRSVIGDGTDQPNGPTVMQRRSLRPNGCHLNVSHWSADGLRPYMEDRYVIDELRSLQKTKGDYSSRSPISKPFKIPMSYFGVFDGHGGNQASQFCSDRLSTYLTHQIEYPQNIGKSLKQAFVSIDRDFVRTGLTDGTTACVCVVSGTDQIICANAGDSRAIVVRRDGSVAKLSRDHKPSVPDETQRITALGGRIVYWGRWRVEGILAVSRSIGDGPLKPYITAEPEICEYNIEEEDMFLIIATDGIWDVMDNLKVADLILSEICSFQNGSFDTDPELLKRAARQLCEKAGSFGSKDNLSVVIVDLKSQS